jgi:O-antigen biosynthesis protein WbqV
VDKLLDSLGVRRSFIAAAHDIIMAYCSFMLALYLRLGSEFNPYDHNVLFGSLVFTATCAVVFYTMKLYQGLWRYASVPDLMAITKSVTITILVFLPIMFLVNRLEGIPRSTGFINWLLLLAMLGGPRFLYRIIKDKRITLDFNSSAMDSRIPVLLVGANYNSELFLKENHNSDSRYRVVGIIDNDPTQIGRNIHGIKVYGNINQLTSIVDKLKIQGKTPHKLVISNSKFDSKLIDFLLKESGKLGLTIAKLPSLSALQSTDNYTDIKPIAPEDLLGRSQAVLDRTAMAKLVFGKNVLITGAGGSIGGELTRQIASYQPNKIILLEISEYNLYAIHKEITDNFPDLEIKGLIADIRNQEHIANIFKNNKPNIVFHAAAIKHVPIAEENISETARTNILGTKNIADNCVQYNVKTMVMISTDKAVNPSSLMGATKKIAENYCSALGKQSQETIFTTVRFGNVLGSSGSVIPLFQQQLEKGGPITVTHPDITRYFMTIREAVELILQSAVLGLNRNSSIFVLNMGESVKIDDLAKQIIRMAGLRPNVDIKIEYTGLRAGEKLYEELFYKTENITSTECSQIMITDSKNEVILSQLNTKLHELADLCKNNSDDEIKKTIQELIPEYQETHPEAPHSKVVA